MPSCTIFHADGDLSCLHTYCVCSDEDCAASPLVFPYRFGVHTAFAVCMIFAQICRCPAVLEAGLEQSEAQLPCAHANPVSPAESTEPTRFPTCLECPHRVYAILFAKASRGDEVFMLFCEDI